MALLTAYCPGCQRAVLLDERGFADGQLLCSACGKASRIVPGCSFSADEHALFDELSEVVAEGRLTVHEARTLSSYITPVLRSGPTMQLLAELVGRLPSLLPTQVAVGANGTAQRRALALLRAILDATASKPSLPPPPSAP